MRFVWQALDWLYNLPWWAWLVAFSVVITIYMALNPDCCVTGIRDEPGPVRDGY